MFTLGECRSESPKSFVVLSNLCSRTLFLLCFHSSHLLYCFSSLYFSLFHASTTKPTQDYMTWSDLRELEHQLGQRWLTHESDDGRWEEYARLHGLAAPRIPPTALMDSSPEVEDQVLRSASRSPSSRQEPSSKNNQTMGDSRQSSPGPTTPSSSSPVSSSPTSSSPTNRTVTAVTMTPGNPFCTETNPFVSNNENNINHGNQSRNGSLPSSSSPSDHNHNNQFNQQQSQQQTNACWMRWKLMMKMPLFLCVFEWFECLINSIVTLLPLFLFQ